METSTIDSETKSERRREPDWDVMLSYRHARNRDAALSLAGFAEEAGLRCWLDVHLIDQETKLPQEELKCTLRRAAEGSRIVVGFLDEDSVAQDSLSGSVQTVFSWRFWERQFAREFVWGTVPSCVLSPTIEFPSLTSRILRTTWPWPAIGVLS